MRPRHLEVEEELGVDLRELLGAPGAREERAGERRALAAVVPAAERRRSGPGCVELGAPLDAELLLPHQAILLSAWAPERGDDHDRRRPDERRERDVEDHEPEWEVRAVLDLADDHLDDEQAEQDQARRGDGRCRGSRAT